MKKTIFTCDLCSKIIAEEGNFSRRHIRIRTCEIRESREKFYPIILNGDLHFCCPACVAKFFKQKLEEIKIGDK